MGEIPPLSPEEIEAIAGQRNPQSVGSNPDLTQVEWLACWAS